MNASFSSEYPPGATTGSPSPAPTERSPGRLRGWLEVLSIPALAVIGAVLGSLSGFPPLSSIGAVGLPLLAASLYLKRSGMPWRRLVATHRLHIGAVAAWTLVALGGALAAAHAATWGLQTAFGLPPTDVSRFLDLVEGNLVMYAWYLIPVAWGSAAIGEELLCRGFLMHRLEGLTGTSAAVVLQAAIFAAAHFYQGVTGATAVFVLALVFGAVYVNNGRNLVPLVIAHGLIDTFAMTALYLGRPELLLGT